MATDFKLPDLGENITSGDIVSVLVRQGDRIQADQPVVEIETDKATVEIPCPQAGTVTKVHVEVGQTVSIGEVLLTLDEKQPGAMAPAAAPSAPETKAAPQSQPAEPPQPAPQRSSRAAAAPVAAPAVRSEQSNGGAARSRPAEGPPQGDRPITGPSVAVPAGPATRRLARELGVDLHRVTGTGPGGRITREDIIAAVRESTASQPPRAAEKGPAGWPAEGRASRDNWGPLRIQKMSRPRKTIAANMARTVEIPQVTNFDDADITELERIRKGSMADYVGSNIKLTMMAFVMKAVAQSLRLHPALNASIDMVKEEIIYKQYVNLGVAVDTERGLIVPVVRDVDQMSIPAIAAALNEVAAKARENRFAVEDTRGGTFTISNLGAIGGSYSTPIVNPPEVAILLVGRARKLPLVTEDDRIEARLLMPLSLSYDHRLLDGAVAARFLNEVKNYLEVPGRLLLAT